MAFRLEPDRPVRRELRRVLRKECRAALGALDREDAESVHDARTHIKKARAATAASSRRATTRLVGWRRG